VRCWVKSRNERNPRLQLPSGNAGHFGETAGDKPEEGGDDVKSSWPLRAGLHTCYNGGDNGMQWGDPEPILKNRLSSDCTLQLECMKLESLVIADQHAAVNTFPSRRGTCGWITSFLRKIGSNSGLYLTSLRSRGSQAVVAAAVASLSFDGTWRGGTCSFRRFVCPKRASSSAG
jgi:hypothetical protein